ncbi:hypothetical protein L9F63_011282, partial [Diploptera punctata]
YVNLKVENSVLSIAHVCLVILSNMARIKRLANSDANRPSVVNSSGSATVEVEDEVMSNPSTSGCVNVNGETPPKFSVNSNKISSGFHLGKVVSCSKCKEEHGFKTSKENDNIDEINCE